MSESTDIPFPCEPLSRLVPSPIVFHLKGIAQEHEWIAEHYRRLAEKVVKYEQARQEQAEQSETPQTTRKDRSHVDIGRNED